MLGGGCRSVLISLQVALSALRDWVAVHARCEIDAHTGWRVGCARTLKEIGSWSTIALPRPLMRRSSPSVGIRVRNVAGSGTATKRSVEKSMLPTAYPTLNGFSMSPAPK